MIPKENIERLSIRYQTSQGVIAREYLQHAFLSELYKQPGADKLLFKGGTALRIIFQSPRFSEDLDFTGVDNLTYWELEGLLTEVYVQLSHWGFNLDIREAKKTTGGYLAKTDFSFYHFKINLKVEVSFRIKKKKARIARKTSQIRSEYLPNYDITHHPIEDIAQGKIAALLSRAKARDWYDLYFFLHNRMLSREHQKHFPRIVEKLANSRTDFKKELKDFLPKSHRMVLKEFKGYLSRELKKYL